MLVAGIEVDASKSYERKADPLPTEVATSGMAATASFVLSSNLLSLNLHAKPLSGEFISILTCHATKLQHLRLAECNIDPPELLSLTKLTCLTSLQLHSVPGSGATLCTLLNMPRLKYLGATGVDVSCADMKSLSNRDQGGAASTKELPLVALSISGCTCSDQGFMVSFLCVMRLVD